MVFVERTPPPELDRFYYRHKEKIASLQNLPDEKIRDLLDELQNVLPGRNVKIIEELQRMFHCKCAFCESELKESRDWVFYRPYQNAQTNKDVDDRNIYYYWLTWSWFNLYASCRVCFEAKGNQFPIKGERAKPGTRKFLELSKEGPLLIDPCLENPLGYLQFDSDGTIKPKSENGIDNEKALKTIVVFKLDRKELKELRHAEAGTLQRLINDALSGSREALDELQKMCLKNSAFLGMKYQLIAEMLSGKELSSTPELEALFRESKEKLTFKPEISEYKDFPNWRDELLERLVDALLKVPATSTFEGRNSLLSGLPKIDLTNRSEDDPRKDIESVVLQLARPEHLNTDTRPLLMLAKTALESIGNEAGTLKSDLQEIIQGLTKFYGGELPTKKLPPIEPEKLLFGKAHDERLQYSFMQRALEISNSVARIDVPRYFNGVLTRDRVVYGTGWIIAPRLIITNHHVIEARVNDAEEGIFEGEATSAEFKFQAEHSVFRFDYYNEGEKSYPEYRNGTLVAYNRELDFAIIEVKASKQKDSRPPKTKKPFKLVAEPIETRKHVKLVAEQPDLKRGDRLNIVQYSQGEPLLYAIRNNFYVAAGETKDFLRYLTDTEGGSSGSPVCNDEWEVVGIHHAATRIEPERYHVPRELSHATSKDSYKAMEIKYHNEGVAIHSILDLLRIEQPRLWKKIYKAQGWS